MTYNRLGGMITREYIFKGVIMKSNVLSRITAPCLLLMLFIILFIGSVRAEADDVEFIWAFIHRGPDGKKEIIDFKKRPKVKEGDKLQIYVQPVSEVYIYLYLVDSSKELYPLFPEEPDFYERNSLENKKYFIPGENDWFTWDDSRGTERFYVFASTQRLKKLEAATQRYWDNPDNSKLKAALLDEIDLTRKRKSQIASTSEKPVAIAGTIRTRGSEPAIKGKAVHVKVEELYGKPLRLKHE